MATLKDTLEVIKAAEVAGDTVADVLADGKATIFDLPKLVKLLAPVKAAVEGIANIPAELKDIDADEAKQLFEAVIAMTVAWSKVFTKAA